MKLTAELGQANFCHILTCLEWSETIKAYCLCFSPVLKHRS